jgi:hypothetical protein
MEVPKSSSQAAAPPPPKQQQSALGGHGSLRSSDFLRGGGAWDDATWAWWDRAQVAIQVLFLVMREDVSSRFASFFPAGHDPIEEPFSEWLRQPSGVPHADRILALSNLQPGIAGGQWDRRATRGAPGPASAASVGWDSSPQAAQAIAKLLVYSRPTLPGTAAQHSSELLRGVHQLLRTAGSGTTL